MYRAIKINEQLLDDFIELIEAHEDDVRYDYKGKENQILLKSGLVAYITSFIEKSLASNKNDFKDLIKAYIRAAFELPDNAVVINKNGNIFIKIIDETVKKQVDEKDKNTVKNRYNGVKEEELKSFYDEFFAEDENKDFFLEIAKEFVHKYFIVKKISNDEYEKNVFAYIHAITLEKLVSIYDNEDGFFLGFAGYIFRIHFKEVFSYIAELILDEIAISNRYMMDFLNYYSQDILVIKGIKYKIPHLDTENDLRWTVPSMLSIVKIYTKAKTSIETLKKEKSQYQKRVQKFYVNGISPIKNNELLMSEKAGIEIEIEHTVRSINILNDKLDITKESRQKEQLQEAILKEEEKLKQLKNHKQETLQKVVKQNGLSEYVALQKELDTLNRKLQREKKILKQNKEAYDSIKSSLVKALISKKSVL
ncbi:coiled-coil domain-containing protein [Sulfurimonas paralvinellae]|uniref:Uncharacterized protein n=1 Tax=Sulfurimonas paralvinellae TaxID=317658 RepID=A0A7M1B6E8_9BACT|nr:hypothetical protein [Sulfurimonas paralvinellae]QOP45309.1 hypothetical protein FM071_03035 [Sulfurimonas paralvinellae]